MALQKIHKDYMLFLQRLFKQIIFILSLSNVAFAQKINKIFHKDSTIFYLTKDTVYLNKNIPIDYIDAIHIALQYYPELNKIEAGTTCLTLHEGCRNYSKFGKELID